MKVSDILIINSYAGSLTIAATQLGLPIRGSYEDAGFGLPVQKANFPNLHYVEKPPWPGQVAPRKNAWGEAIPGTGSPSADLTRTMVIAHPPCAAFSTQSPYKKGIYSDHFKPHKLVMDYALGQGAAALAIESVPGILKGATEVQQGYAKKHGYQLYWILQNAVTFGVPQWRPRVWTIFTKLPQLVLSHQPAVKRIEDILLKQPGTVLAPNSEIRGALRCLAAAGYDERRVYKELLSGEHVGSLLAIGQKVLGIEDVGPNHIEVRKRWHLAGRFGVKLPRVLNPEEFATTILHDSSFFVMGRELYLEEYCAIMGFPADYRWPGNTLKDFRLYLSKGVCPPVALWILEQLRDNLAGVRLADLDAVANLVKLVKPGEVADFTLSREQLKQQNLFSTKEPHGNYAGNSHQQPHADRDHQKRKVNHRNRQPRSRKSKKA